MKQPLDLLVYRQYEKQGIRVVVEINRMKKTVTLMEYNRELEVFQPKSYLFEGRELEYMNGWLAILAAIQYAVTQAKKELEIIKDEDIDKFATMFMALDRFKDKD